MKLMILDSNSILNRAFYGMPPLNNSKGQPTNAVLGFLNILLKLMEDEKPDYIAAAFDVGEKTFRHIMFTQYKAQRKGMPETLASQLPIAKQLLDCMNIMRLEFPGYEGDDIIGSAVRQFSSKGIECVIVTGDRDSLQLVDDRTRVLLSVSKASGSESVNHNSDVIMKKYGVSPLQLIDVKAIMGDPSDNIPGVSGIGEKGALDLIRKFGNLEGVYENIDSPDIKPAQRQKLLVSRDIAYLSKTLATIKTDMDLNFSEQDILFEDFNRGKLFALLRELEFNAAITRLNLKDSEDNISRVDVTEIDSDLLLNLIHDNSIIAFYPQKKKMYIHSNGILYYTEPDKEFYKKIFENESIKKVTFDAKPFIIQLLNEGIELKGLDFDIKIAAYILNPSTSNYILYSIINEHLAVSVDCEACACAYFLAVADKMKERIANENMNQLFYEIELPLITVLAQMEFDGFSLDRQQLEQFGIELSQRLDQLTQTIYFMAGKKFNINSTKQLGEVLFVDLGLPSFSKTKTGYSTSADVLDKLRGYHDIIDAILEYRRLSKLNSTYVDGFVGLIGADGRIHSVFNQTITQTGRISSSEPNLQNIPVRQPMGKQLRKMFTAQKDWLLIDADYSQIELRVLAHISNDKNMLAAFKNELDIHTITASEVFKVPLSMVTSEMRSRAKAVNFGIVYGISDFSLAADIKATRKEARQYIDNYFQTYKGVKEYLDSTVLKAKECGFVTTMFNRRRYIPELSVQNRNVQAFGERVAMNTPIQGSAADILKIAMVNVYRRLKENGLKARIILQVHDELIIECPKNEVEAAKAILSAEMEQAGNLSIPLKVDIGNGFSWYDAKE